MEFETPDKRRKFAAYILTVTNVGHCTHRHDTVNFVRPKEQPKPVIPTVTIRRGCVVATTGEVKVIDLDRQ